MQLHKKLKNQKISVIIKNSKMSCTLHLILIIFQCKIPVMHEGEGYTPGVSLKGDVVTIFKDFDIFH